MSASHTKIILNTKHIKRQNIANTLQLIMTTEKISLLDLSKKLSLSTTSIQQNVKNLVNHGLVVETGTYDSTGGRKARAFSPVRNARLAIGINVTKNHINAVRINLAGAIEVVKRIRVPFSPDATYMNNLSEIVAQFSSGVENTILGVGISLPGILDAEGRNLAYSHVLNLRDFDTANFTAKMPYSCLFINDASSAALAEFYGQSESGLLAYLSLSNSVGGAILENGKLCEGQNMRAGEFGHMTLAPDGRPCYCGKKGCMDAYCSASLLSSQTDGNLEEFFRLLEQGDIHKKKIWRECMAWLAIAVNNLNMALDCKVMVGGYLGPWLKKFNAEFEPMVAERNTFGRDISWLRYCSYKNEASAVGAALLPIKSFIRSLS